MATRTLFIIHRKANTSARTVTLVTGQAPFVNILLLVIIIIFLYYHIIIILISHISV